jgi:hypothetical protein
MKVSLISHKEVSISDGKQIDVFAPNIISNHWRIVAWYKDGSVEVEDLEHGWAKAEQQIGD